MRGIFQTAPLVLITAVKTRSSRRRDQGISENKWSGEWYPFPGLDFHSNENNLNSWIGPCYWRFRRKAACLLQIDFVPRPRSLNYLGRVSPYCPKNLVSCSPTGWNLVDFSLVLSPILCKILRSVTVNEQEKENCILYNTLGPSNN